MTIHVSIGNSDDKLSQAKWADFYSQTDSAIRMRASTVYGAWLSVPSAPWQNACWAFDVEGAPLRHVLRERLRWLARDYGQDSIAWCEGETEFLGAVQ